MMPNANTADHCDQPKDGNYHPSPNPALCLGSIDNLASVLWIQQHFVNVDRLSNVLDRMRSKIGETDIELAVYLIENASGNTDTTRISKVLDPCGNVHAIPINAVIFVDDLSQIYADTKNHTTIIGQFAIFYFQYILGFDSAIEGIQGTAEFGQDIVTRCIDDPPTKKKKRKKLRIAGGDYQVD